MKVFITGIQGFLGRHLANKFINLNNEVIGCDDLSGVDIDNFHTLEIIGKKVT